MLWCPSDGRKEHRLLLSTEEKDRRSQSLRTMKQQNELYYRNCDTRPFHPRSFLHSPKHSNCPPLLVDGSLLHRCALASAVYEGSTVTTEPTNALLLNLNTTMQQHIPSRDLGLSLRHGCHQNCTTSQCPCFGKMQCLHKAL